ncbi:MAG: APC family permease [Alphaproteobacteria bacterium]
MGGIDREAGPPAGAGQPALRRTLSLPMLTLYGVGTTVGAGIFVLLGEVVGAAGVFAPLSFLLAAALAGLSALGFAELSARFPLSAGEAVYVERTLGVRSLGVGAGLLVALAGISSSAAISVGFVGYVQHLVEVPGILVLLCVMAVLGGLAAWGIRESVMAAAVITVAEVLTLVIVAVSGIGHLGDIGGAAADLPLSEDTIFAGVMAGAVLAFFAFIGFEDMVNVAEEVRDVERVLPRAILLTLGITTLAYLAVSLVAISAPDPAALVASDAPLAVLQGQLTGTQGKWVSLVALVSVLNGALVQIVMAARVLYGLSRQGWLPAAFGAVNERRRTPLVATGAVVLVIFFLAALFPVRGLAEATSTLMLAVFATVNFGLWRYKQRRTEPPPAFRIPSWVCLAGALAASGILIYTAAAKLNLF